MPVCFIKLQLMFDCYWVIIALICSFILKDTVFFIFSFPWTTLWAKVLDPLGVLGKVSPISLQRDAVNRYLLCLNKTRSLACSHVLASINSISLDASFSPCINLNFGSSFRSKIYWESLSLVSLNENKGYCKYIWLHFFWILQIAVNIIVRWYQPTLIT